MPSSVNFGRRYKITLFNALSGGLIVPNPLPVVTDPTKMTFSYSVSPFAFNVCTFHFFNLDPFVVADMSNGVNKGLILECAYEGGDIVKAATTYEEFFKGLIFKTNTYRVGADLITQVICYDTLFSLTAPKVKLSFPEFTTGSAILSAVLAEYKLTSVSVKGSQYLTKIYSTPVTLVNQHIDNILKNLASDNSCYLYVTGEEIIFYPNQDSPLPQVHSGAPVIVSTKNGLVGNIRSETLSLQLLPVDYFAKKDLTKNMPLITVTTLLRKVKLFTSVQLIDPENDSFRKLDWQILSMAYTGDSRGTEWYTTMKLVPRKA